MDSHFVVLDVGKTHAKVTVLDAAGRVAFSRRTSNNAQYDWSYTCLDLDGIWDFFARQLQVLTGRFHIKAITTATHGAAAVLLDQATGEPAVPAMDYEWNGYARQEYDALRPAFEQTLSPNMPMGLNLGRQIHYQLKLLNDAQRRRVTILLYPNYWAWRLTGVASAEVTSLGCHTDLWNPKAVAYSDLVEALDVRSMLPPLKRAAEPLARVSPQCAAATGLPKDCLVYPGMHDSNAGYYPHLAVPAKDRPTVISTGTWSVAMSPQTPLTALDQKLDMLANVDAEGAPVPTARYLGGREFARLCEMTNCDVATHCEAVDLAQIISGGVFALPSFGDGSGPLGSRTGVIEGAPHNGKALATLYSALMLDQLLVNLGSRNDIVVEGSFAANDLLCGTLAALRPGQRVHQFRQSGGVVTGCFASMNPDTDFKLNLDNPIAPLQLEGLEDYAVAWRERASCPAVAAG